ncbi:MAG: hypothetical protein HKO94_07765 [Flavobacteriaceae bacterium]|nr:hypothetical protein [Flavobacteriaceae bacterium]
MKNPCVLFLTSLIFLLHSTFLLQSQDSSWISQAVPFEKGTISDLVFVDEHKGWAVGQDYDNGQMVILNTMDAGEVWTQQTVPDINAFLSRIVMIDTNKGYAVGTQYSSAVGVYTLDGGQNWMVQNLPDDVKYVDGLTVYEEKVWAVGGGDSSAVILELTDDSTWSTSLSIPLSGFFNSIQFIDPHHGWAAGADWTTTFGEPLLARTDDGGDNWEVIDLPVDSGFLTDVSFINPDRGWAVGSASEDFLFMESEDGGLNWTVLDSLGVSRFGPPGMTASRMGSFNKVVQLQLKRDLFIVYGVMSNQVFSPLGLRSTTFKLLILGGFMKKYNIGLFETSYVLKIFMHSYGLRPLNVNKDSGIKRANYHNLNPGDLVCYAYGSVGVPQDLDKPVIFRKQLNHSFLNTLQIQPENLDMTIGDSVILHVIGRDQHDEIMDVEAPIWNATGGGVITIQDSLVVFKAETEGDYIINCREYYTGILDSILVHIDPLSNVDDKSGFKIFSHSLKIFPNPGRHSVQVNFKSQQAGELSMKILDQLGRLQYHYIEHYSSGQHNFNCSTDKLTPGIYFVLFDFIDEQARSKLLILN